MATTARLDLSIWRNDDVYEFPIRVVGVNLTGVAMKAQIRLRPDTPGEPLVALAAATNANAEGIRLASATLVDGVWVNDVRVRINKSTRQNLPYAGELGDAAVLAWAFQIGGRTRLVGDVRILAHAIDSNSAPVDRPTDYQSSAKFYPPAGGALLSIASDDVAVIKLDGADLVQPLVEEAQSNAEAAIAANVGAQIAATTAMAFTDGKIYPTTAAGLGATAPGDYFVVGDPLAKSLTLFRDNNGAAQEIDIIPTASTLRNLGAPANVTTGTQSDQAASLNTQLADAGTLAVVAPTGVIWINETIVVPAGKALRLQSGTIIRALPTFQFVNGNNHGVLLAGNRASIIGGTIDMNKVGLGSGTGARVNGVTVLNGARDCRRDGVQVMNCTGYGVYDSGVNELTAPPSSLNIGLRVLNCQVHYEQQGSDGSTYINCRSGDGAGDIPCLSWIHPLVGAKNTTFIDFDGVGITPVGVDVAANIANIEGLVLDNVRIRLTNGGGVGMNVNPGNNDTLGLKVASSRFIAPMGIAATLSKAFGTFSDTTFEGQTGVEHTDSMAEFTACDVKASSTTSASPVGIIAQGVGQARWSGGAIAVTAIAGIDATVFQGNVAFSGGTKTSVKQGSAAATSAPSVPFVRQEAYGVADLEGNGANRCIANIFLPVVQQDPAKCFVTFSLRNTSAGNSAAPTAVPASSITWRFQDTGALRVFIDGADLSQPFGAYQLSYHFVERE